MESGTVFRRCAFKISGNPKYQCPKSGDMYQPHLDIWYCKFHDKWGQNRCQVFAQWEGTGIQCTAFASETDEETGKKLCKKHVKVEAATEVAEVVVPAPVVVPAKKKEVKKPIHPKPVRVEKPRSKPWEITEDARARMERAPVKKKEISKPLPQKPQQIKEEKEVVKNIVMRPPVTPIKRKETGMPLRHQHPKPTEAKEVVPSPKVITPSSPVKKKETEKIPTPERANVGKPRKAAVEAAPKTEPAPVKMMPPPVKIEPLLKKVEPKKVEPKKVELKKVEPKKIEPIVTTIELAPEKIEPAPVKIEPAQVEVEPVPIEVKPVPVEVKPVPVEVEPAPVEVEPTPVEIEPTPAKIIEADEHVKAEEAEKVMEEDQPSPKKLTIEEKIAQLKDASNRKSQPQEPEPLIRRFSRRRDDLTPTPLKIITHPQPIEMPSLPTPVSTPLRKTIFHEQPAVQAPPTPVTPSTPSTPLRNILARFEQKEANSLPTPSTPSPFGSRSSTFMASLKFAQHRDSTTPSPLSSQPQTPKTPKFFVDLSDQSVEPRHGKRMSVDRLPTFLCQLNSPRDSFTDEVAEPLTPDSDRYRIATLYQQCNICLTSHLASVMRQITPCGHQYRPLCLQNVIRNGSRRQYNCSSCRDWLSELRTT